jgi:hypothetical protein
MKFSPAMWMPRTIFIVLRNLGYEIKNFVLSLTGSGCVDVCGVTVGGRVIDLSISIRGELDLSKADFIDDLMDQISIFTLNKYGELFDRETFNLYDIKIG